jgi:hypothetical protein
VVTTPLPSGPLVFDAAHRGGANFVIQLRGPGGEELLVNEIGNYKGQVVGETEAGRHRVIVTADGSWTIRIQRPTRLGIRSVPGSFVGNGSKVVTVRSSRSRELVLTASNASDDNFIIYLYGYAGSTGSDLLVNEIGPWRGQVIADVPAGHLLLAVQASGRWSARFRP